MSKQLENTINKQHEQLQMLSAEKQACYETINQIVNVNVVLRTQVIMSNNLVKDRDTKITALNSQLAKITAELNDLKTSAVSEHLVSATDVENVTETESVAA